MKTDTIFYNLFQTFPSIFFELINRAPEEANNYEFTSREVKQFSFRLDGLFLPKTNQPNQPVYVVEVQFQPDSTLYYRIFAEFFIYLRQYQPPHPWQIVVIYPTRSIERQEALHFGNLLNLPQVRRIYLDELRGESSLGVGIVKLVIEPEKTAGAEAKRLIAQTREQLTDESIQRDLINLIETIIVYKLPKKSREEIAAMLGLTSELKKTRFYQDVYEESKEEIKQETKLETIPRLLPLGLTLEQIAQALELPLEVVQQKAEAARSQPQSSAVEVGTQLSDSPPEVVTETSESPITKPMSFAEQNVAAFIELLTKQRNLFTPEECEELNQLFPPIPDNIEELSQVITTWCHNDNRAEITNALQQIRQTLSSDAEERILDTQESEESPPQLNKQTLQDAIKRG